MAKKFTKEEMQQILQSLDKEFELLLKSEDKDEDHEKLIDDIAEKNLKEKDEEKKPLEEKDEHSSDKEELDPEKKISKEEDKKEEEEEHKEDLDKEEKDDLCPYSEEEMEELKKIYSSMSEAERKAHKEALEKCGEINKYKPVHKSEDGATDLLKKELDQIKLENQSLKKHVEGLVSALNKFVTKVAPERKAVTSLEIVKKSEDSEPKVLTKSEIDSKLRKKIESRTLSFSDRELINRYYLEGLKVDAIKHLLD